MFTIVSLSRQVWAESPDLDKQSYHLFNPTPKRLMRPLAADRPDGTESPITVDAGHVQVETSFLDFTHDDADGDKIERWNIFDANLKVGLLDHVDLQLLVTAHSREESIPAGSAGRTLSGLGDLIVRLKMNLWGNDPPRVGDGQGDSGTGDWGYTAMGIMPFITIPSGSGVSNGHVEGGLIVMWTWFMADGRTLGLQVEADAVYDESDDDYVAEIGHTAVLGFDLIGPLGSFVEYIGVLGTDSQTDYQAQFSTGLTFAINRDVVLDAGIRIGLNEAADDINIFTGMTVRY